jgi:hypothetical protein
VGEAAKNQNRKLRGILTMSKKIGTITFSPTAVTDKEEVHEIHKRTEEGGNAAEWKPECFRVVFTRDVTDIENQLYTCDKTYEQIVDAVESGKFVYANVFITPSGFYDHVLLYYVGLISADVDKYVVFRTMGNGYSIAIFEDNSVLRS